jgi:hypothetical protein
MDSCKPMGRWFSMPVLQPFTASSRIDASFAPFATRSRHAIANSLILYPTGPVGGLCLRPTMIKNLAAAAVALFGISLADQFLTNGQYTDAVIAMLRQIRYSFGI